MKSQILAISLGLSLSLSAGAQQSAKKPTKTPAKKAAAVSTGSLAEKGKALFVKKNFALAAQSFYLALRTTKDRHQAAQIRYQLAVSLRRAGLRQPAAFYLAGLVKNQEKNKLRALDTLVAIANELDEPSMLHYALNKIAVNDLTETSKAIVYQRLGDSFLKSGRFDDSIAAYNKALALDPVNENALYSVGTVYSIKGMKDQAISNYQVLYDRYKTQKVTDYKRGSAILALARAYYAKKSWKEAISLYREIPKDHQLYRESLSELSWALFRNQQFRSAMGPLQTLHTEYYKNFYDPESLYLRGVILLYICHYDEIEILTNSFDVTYKPVLTRMVQWLKSSSSADAGYKEVESALKTKIQFTKTGDVSTDGAIPFFVMRTILDEPDIRANLKFIETLNKEHRTNETLFAKSAPQLFKYNKKVINNRINAAKKNIGSKTRSLMSTMLRDLVEYSNYMDFLKFEYLSGTKAQLKRQMSVTSRPSISSELSRDYFIQNGYRYWPFDGEYWRDEIGNYLYTGVSTCEK